MAKGRPPTPKAVLQLRGSKLANSRAELGSMVTDSLPEPPTYLKPRAAQMFLQVCSWTRDMGTLADSDAEVIARYAATWDRWVTAEEALKDIEHAYIEVCDPKTGDYKFSRPCGPMAQSSAMHEQMRQLETVLGLTPADRTRLGYGVKEIEVDPVDSLLRQVGQVG